MIFIVRKKRFFAFLTMVFISLGTIFLGYTFSGSVLTATSKTDWGLGYGESGSAPTGNMSKEELSKFDAFYVGDTTRKEIYLTFDAGYENGYTPQILDVLKKHNANATFFLVGNYLETSPDLVKRMVAEGHHVGNHTLSHPDMSKISDKASFQKELNELEKMFKQVTGKEMEKIYRPPQGKFNENNLKMAKELGYKTYFWSLAYVDWLEGNQPTRDFAFSKLIPRIHNGAIVLLHSTSKTNAEILDELLTKWKEMGYTFGDITKL